MKVSSVIRFTTIFLLLSVAGTLLSGCSREWETFRHDVLRTAHQANKSALSDPAQVPTLKVLWQWRLPAVTASNQRRGFRSSPVVDDGRVYIGGGDGRLYAFNAVTGAPLWQYPAVGQQPLTSQFTCNPSSFGIASSPAIARIGNTKAVIFGAPDRSVGSGLGEGRLFALNASTGAVIWKSPVLAQLTGTTSWSLTEFHQQIGYSSPLVFNNRVYIGTANHCDNPIQQGRVKAVDLQTGALIGGFNFVGASTRGGGVWTTPSTDLGDVYITTGNIRSGNPGGEPPINNALAMVRLDRDTGNVVWKLQPVPFALDADPDWSAGTTTVLANCETLITSTMKDGWTYAVRPGDGTPGPADVRWQFPATGFPFTPGDGTVHGDTRFLRPGAAWGSTFITMSGGLNTTTNLTSNYSRLHALNVCANNQFDRIRWIKDVPHTSGGAYSLGSPTVTRGIVYVGTNQGWLVVIADPSVSPPDGYRCSHPDVPSPFCSLIGLPLVPDPAILKEVQLNGSIQTEPVLAKGRVYVATDSGWLYMLAPLPPGPFAAEGKMTLLRVHDVGTKYGKPPDQLDVEVIIWLDSQPDEAFGFQLRTDENESARRGMLDLLRDAFSRDRTVRIDYIRTGLTTGRIIRVMTRP